MRRVVWALLLVGSLVLLAAPAHAVELPAVPTPVELPESGVPVPSTDVAPPPVTGLPVETPAVEDLTTVAPIPDVPAAGVPDVPVPVVPVPDVPVRLDGVTALVPDVHLDGVVGATTPSAASPADGLSRADAAEERPAAHAAATAATDALSTRATSAQLRPPASSELSSVLRAAKDSAGEFVLPFALVVIVLAFLLVQPWFDQGDGRLAAVTVDDEKLGFS